MKDEVIPGRYRHYKGGVYDVIDTAEHTETTEDLVLYRDVKTGRLWARPARMWFEIVEGGIPRFSPLNAETKR